jgi:TPR repeat protein
MSAQELSDLIDLAKNENADAQKIIAAKYYYGEGVEKDLSIAATWFEKAANNNDAQAQYVIAYMYRNGEGYAQDSIKAFEWYKKSAEQGYMDSEVELANCYYTAFGIEQNFEESAVWYQKAAEKGNKIAQHSLGYLFLEGQGPKKDNEQAIFWFKKAVAQENMDSYIYLARLLYDGNDSTKYSEAFRLFKILADEENAESQFKLGVVYLEAKGVEGSDEKAFEWIKDSAAQNYLDALYKLSYLYENGIGTEIDTALAREYKEKADELEYDWMNWFWF